MCDLYGIPNCDTIKKARKWLQAHDVAYQFHDYKKEGIDSALLHVWVEQKGWGVLLNRRGTTWRKLPDAQKEQIDSDKAVLLMCQNPSMIKRPVLVMDELIEVGFSELRYAEIFS